MSWISLAVLAYFLLAVESVANKFLITGRIKNWKLYLFYIGLFSVFAFVLAPFGMEWKGAGAFFWALFAGVLSFGYLLFLFWSLEKSSPTRVYVLIGSIATISAAALSALILGEEFSHKKILGIGLLAIGGFFASYRFRHRKMFGDYRKAIVAGILLAAYYVIMKKAFGELNFVSGYVYSRIGVIATTLIFFALPSFRKETWKLLRGKNRSEHVVQGGSVLIVKAVAGISAALLQLSISLGSVAIVTALSSVQYLFVFAISVFLASFVKSAFHEGLDRKSLLLKLTGVILVVVGVALAAR